MHFPKLPRYAVWIVIAIVVAAAGRPILHACAVVLEAVAGVLPKL